MSIDLSLVIPVFNEQENIQPLLRGIVPVLKKLKLKFEIIIIDDGSFDNTWSELLKLQKKLSSIVIIQFRRNFGQTAAISAGFSQAQGNIVITLDGDLQNDPQDIPVLIEKINQGFDVVSGWRKNRNDESKRVLISQVANKLIGLLTNVNLHDFGCTLKAYRIEIVKELRLYGEMHRFIPAVAASLGAKITEVEVSHHRRFSGKSKYGFDRTFRVILDMVLIKFLLDFQNRPVQLFGGVGLTLASIGFSVFTYLSYRRLVWLEPLSNRPLFLVSIFMVLVGIQLISIGIIAEMLMRIYYESQGKKPYFIRQIVGSNKV